MTSRWASGWTVSHRALDEVGPDPSETKRQTPREIRWFNDHPERILMQLQISWNKIHHDKKCYRSDNAERLTVQINLQPLCFSEARYF